MGKLSPQQAQQRLWLKGNLRFKLHAGQIKIDDAYKASKARLFVANCSRRLGKTYWALVKAIEVAMTCKLPNPRIFFASATKHDLKKFVLPAMAEVLVGCPDELMPQWRPSEEIFRFPNGAEMHLLGLDERPDGIRGAYADLYIFEEAGQINNLSYLYSSVVYPLLMTRPGSRVIMISTPSPTPAHPFKDFEERAKARNSAICLTIDDNPMLTPEEKAEALAECLTESERQREWYCFGAETPVLTRDGFKEIQNVAIGDHVLTETGAYKQVLNVWKNPLGNRKTYKLFNNRVTGNHKILIAEGNRKVVGQPFFQSVETLQPVQNKQRSNRRIYAVRPIAARGITFDISPELAELTGWYLAEGTCSKDTQSVSFSLGPKDPIPRIQELIFKCFGKYAANKGFNKHSCCQLRLNSKTAKTYFSQFGSTADKKNMPGWVFSQTRHTIEPLVNAYFTGDGCWIGKERQAATISRMLAVGMEELLIQLGHTPRVLFQPKPTTGIILGRKVNLRDTWAIRYSVSSRRRDFNTGQFLYKQICQTPQVISNSDEWMYTLEVEDIHSYCVSGLCAQNCKHVVDEHRAIVPEWDMNYERDVARPSDWDFVDCYTSMDLGTKIDLTAILFGYYDATANAVVVEDERDINGPSMTTIALKDLVLDAEKQLWDDKKPLKRVSDSDNPLLIQDLGLLHKVHFTPTSKDNLHAMVNELRVLIKRGGLIVSPKCQKLIGCLRYGIWNKKRVAFDRTPLYGHFDHLAALIYLVRNVVYGQRRLKHRDNDDSNRLIRRKTAEDYAQMAELRKLFTF